MDNCKDASEWFSWGQIGKMVELQRKNGIVQEYDAELIKLVMLKMTVSERGGVRT